MGAFAPAQQLDIEARRGAQFIDKYRALSRCTDHMQRTRETSREPGYVWRLVFGRRPWLSDIKAAAGRAAPCGRAGGDQRADAGTAADLIVCDDIAV